MTKTRLKLHNKSVLWPERRSAEQVAALRKVTPRAIFESTYQQNDAISFGSVFERSWWNYWQLPSQDLPPVFEVDSEGNIHECILVKLPKKFTLQLQSWDLTFSEKKTAAFNVGQVWGRLGADAFLLDMVRGRWDFPTLMSNVQTLARKWPAARPILIENKANGPAIIQMLRKKVAGIIGVEPKGDKVSRANAVTIYVEAGNVFLPHPALREWTEIFVDEVSTFPGSEYKDVTDTATQALSRLFLKTGGFTKKPVKTTAIVTG